MAASSGCVPGGKDRGENVRLRDFCEAHPPVTGFPLTNPTGRHFQFRRIHLQDRARKSRLSASASAASHAASPPIVSHAMPGHRIGRNRCI